MQEAQPRSPACWRAGADKAWLAIGIPSVPRKNSSDYLTRTLESLLEELPGDATDPLYGRVRSVPLFPLHCHSALAWEQTSASRWAPCCSAQGWAGRAPWCRMCLGGRHTVVPHPGDWLTEPPVPAAGEGRGAEQPAGAAPGVRERAPPLHAAGAWCAPPAEQALSAGLDQHQPRGRHTSVSPATCAASCESCGITHTQFCSALRSCAEHCRPAAAALTLLGTGFANLLGAGSTL